MTRTYDSDALVQPHLHGVLQALRDVMLELRLGEPCTLTPIAGASVALDYIGDECENYAWARVVNSYPSFFTFPEPDPRPAPAIVLASIIELGLMRRMDLPDNGEPISPEQQAEDARRSGAEMQAMLIALCRYAGDDVPIVVGQYTPVGPDGGVIGGVWTATLGER